MEKRTNVAARSGSGVHSDNDSAFKTECKCCCAVLNLDAARGICMIISVQLQELSRLLER